MGETWEDRISMALVLKKLNVDSVPINILVPIEGAEVSFNGIGGIPMVVATVSELGNLNVAVPVGGFDVLVAKDFSLASLSVNIAAGVDVNISAGGKVGVSALGDASVNAGGKASIIAGGDADITAGGAANITAGGSVDINASGLITVQAATAMLLESLVEITVLSPLVLLGPAVSPGGYKPMMTEGGGFSFGVVVASS